MARHKKGAATVTKIDAVRAARRDGDHPAAAYARRIASLEDEVAELRADVKAVYVEAKEAGFLRQAIRGVVKRIRETDEQRQTRETIEAERDQILAAIGLLAGTPLGDAAVAAAVVGPELDLAASPAEGEA